ncbi:exopolysaccharide biosynthesis protein [Pseudorhizobium pelagicum]
MIIFEESMAEKTRALSDVLDQLEESAHGDSIAIQDVIEKLGHRSFGSLMLVFSLISTSPASAIPGITATVAVIVFILVAQMIIGRDSVWLPGFVTRRRMSTAKLCKGIGWLRKPVRFVERFLKARLTFLFHRPWLWLPLSLILALTLFMPFMEIIPTSGSIASAVIALFAAGLLARDGVLVVLSLILLSAVPVAVWYFGFSG